MTFGNVLLVGVGAVTPVVGRPQLSRVLIRGVIRLLHVRKGFSKDARHASKKPE